MLLEDMRCPRCRFTAPPCSYGEYCVWNPEWMTTLMGQRCSYGTGMAPFSSYS